MILITPLFHINYLLIAHFKNLLITFKLYYDKIIFFDQNVLILL